MYILSLLYGVFIYIMFCPNLVWCFYPYYILSQACMVLLSLLYFVSLFSDVFIHNVFCLSLLLGVLSIFLFMMICISTQDWGPGWPSDLGSWFKLTHTDHCILSPIWREFAPGFVPYKNGLRLTRIARDKVCQLPAQGQWCSPGTPTSSTSKTDRRDMTEMLLKVALNTNQTNKQTNQ